MKKLELTKLYKKVAKEIGFKEDLTHKGWMPKLGPNDFKCKIVHGFTKDGPATLTVGPKDFLDPNFLLLDGNYKLAQVKAPKPHIVIPRILDVKTNDSYCRLTKEKISGVNPLNEFPWSSNEEKEDIAKLYWNTVAVFSAIEREELLAPDFEDFFRKRTEKWVETGKSCESKLAKQKYEVFRTIAGDVFRYVFYETDLGESADLEMQLFFKNFGNTDIVFQNNNFYLPNSEIIPLPQFYGVAYFVWNVLMYSYNRYDSSLPDDFIYERIVEGVEDWRGEFYLLCPDDLKDKFHASFYLLLFERVIATLLVDIPLRRSPFDVKGKEGRERVKSAEKVFVELLKYLLNTIPALVKNEPFKENFEALKKIYKS